MRDKRSFWTVHCALDFIDEVITQEERIKFMLWVLQSRVKKCALTAATKCPEVVHSK